MSGAAHPRIGCAGWSLGSAERALFDAGDSMLARYATRFDAVEVNSSFYRPHKRATYRRWADSVPAGFRFSVKMPKTITHEMGLRGVGDPLDRFLGEVEGLGPKLGGLLIQLPPSLAFDARVASTFFAMLRRRTAVPLACEPRHASWFTPSVEAMLRDRGVTRVAADPAPVAGAEHVAGGGTWRYWRWHGSPDRYYSRYDDAALIHLAAAVRTETPKGVVPWLIFDNTANGQATTNAMSLQTLCGVGPVA